MNSNLRLFVIIILITGQTFLAISQVRCNENIVLIQPSDADTYVSSLYLYTKYPEKSHGYLWGMFAGNTYYDGEDVYGSNRIYIKFDLDSIPKRRKIMNASLQLYLYSPPSTTQRYDAHLVIENWDEDKLFWVNQPDFREYPTSSILINSTSDVWINWDITEAVKAWYSHKTENYGLMIKIENERNATDENAAFHPKEAFSAELRPKLVIHLDNESDDSKPMVGDFLLSVSPQNDSVFQGNKTFFNLKIDKIENFNQPINLKALDLPTGMEDSFIIIIGNTTSIPPFISKLMIDVDLNSLPGIYPIKIEASGGGINHSTSIQLTIKERPKIETTLTLKLMIDGDKVNISGNISPLLDGAKIRLIFTGPDGQRVLHNVSTTSWGQFNYEFSTPLDGVWIVHAEWDGDENYMPAKSPLKSFEIESRYLERRSLYIYSITFAIIASIILLLYLKFKPIGKK